MFWNRELPGFGVRVHPSGRKVYVAQTCARGKAAKRVTVAAHGVLTAEEARRRAALIIARITAGEEPVPEPMACLPVSRRWHSRLAGPVIQRVIVFPRV